MTDSKHYALILNRVPMGFSLPPRFDELLAEELPFDIQWTDLEPYELNPSALEQAVSFIHLPDGDLVALWYNGPSPAIVLIGGDGEHGVIASDFADFLRAINHRGTGVWDIDESDVDFYFHSVEGEPHRKDLAELQDEFNKWIEQHRALLTPNQSVEAGAIRERIFQIAKDMIQDGLSKVYTLSSVWWSMDFRIELLNSVVSIAYLDYGEWYAVPEKYALTAEVQKLLSFEALAKGQNLDW